jgi:hypothetical protein
VDPITGHLCSTADFVDVLYNHIIGGFLFLTVVCHILCQFGFNLCHNQPSEQVHLGVQGFLFALGCGRQQRRTERFLRQFRRMREHIAPIAEKTEEETATTGLWVNEARNKKVGFMLTAA